MMPALFGELARDDRAPHRKNRLVKPHSRDWSFEDTLVRAAAQLANHGHSLDAIRSYSLEQLELFMDALAEELGAGGQDVRADGKQVIEKNGQKFLYDPNAKLTSQQFKLIRPAADLRNFKQ